MRRRSLNYRRLALSRPLDPKTVERLIHQLTTAGSIRPLVFETRADASGITNLIGTAASQQVSTSHLIESMLPGSRLLAAPQRTPLVSAARLNLASPLPLIGTSGDEALSIIHTLYAVFASCRKNEQLAIQLICGASHGPSVVPAQIQDPTPSLWQALTKGIPAAPSEVRRRVVEHASHARIDVTVRFAVTAVSSERRKHLILQLTGALAVLEAPGATFDLRPENPEHFQRAATARGALRLSTAELLPLLAWPLGDESLPGTAPLHPRLLPAPASLSDTESVFARTTSPGDCRFVGIRPEAKLHHVELTGSTGAGKSQVLALLALSDIRAGRPLMLIEPKRQLVDYIVDHAPEDAAGRIAIMDAADEHPFGFNPLDVGDRDIDVAADSILADFKAVFELENAPRAEDLLHVSLLSLLHAGQARGTPYTLLDLPRLLQDDAFRREVVGAIAGEQTLAAYWAGFDAMSAASRVALTAAPLNRLRKFVLRKHVATVLGQAQPKYRLRDIWKDGTKAILVPLNEALIGTGAAQLLGSLVVSEVWLATLERAAERDPMKRPGFVYVDEVQEYLHLPTSISDALATSRSYGVGWHLAHQHRGQISKSMLADLDVLARNKIFFAASPDDARDYAKMAPQLDADDFMALPAHHVYANLVDQGAPAGWFSAATIAPDKPTGHGNKIRRVSRERYGAKPSPSTPPATSTPTPIGSTTNEPMPPASGPQTPRRPARKPRSTP